MPCRAVPCHGVSRRAQGWHSPATCEGGKTSTAPRGFLPSFPHLALGVGAVGARPASPLAGGSFCSAARAALTQRETCRERRRLPERGQEGSPVTGQTPRPRDSPVPGWALHPQGFLSVSNQTLRPQMFPLTEPNSGIPGVPLPQRARTRDPSGSPSTKAAPGTPGVPCTLGHSSGLSPVLGHSPAARRLQLPGQVLSVSWRRKPSPAGDTGTRGRSWVGFSWPALKPSCFDSLPWDTPQKWPLCASCGEPGPGQGAAWQNPER